MEFVKRLFITYIEKQQETKGNRKRQAENIDEAENFILQQIPAGDFDVIFQHLTFNLLGDGWMIR